MESFWRPLRLSESANNVPLLLTKYEFGLSNYTVFISDLTHIWTEHLDRKQILRRALSIDPSIDPSEDADQMQQFLRNVRDSLNGGKGTKLSLSRGDTSQQLVLNTFTSLPSPLEPLEWPIHLNSAAQRVFSNELVLPCLSQELNDRAQIDSLLQHLRDKDHVINRLTQKMESDGLDYSKIFPSVAVSKAANRFVSRKSCAKLVKGLGEFDEDEWRTCFTTKSSSLDDIVSGLFAPDTKDIPDVNFKVSDFSPWWDRLEEKDNMDRKDDFGPPNSGLVSKPTTTLPADVIGSDRDFQRQMTPPQLKPLNAHQDPAIVDKREEQQTRISSPKSAGGFSTTDGSDEELVVLNPKRRSSAIINDAGDAHASNRPGSAVGTKLATKLSGKHQCIKEESISFRSAAGNGQRHENGAVSPDPVDEKLCGTNPAVKPKVKLGTIGGKRKARDEASEPLSQNIQENNTAHHSSVGIAGTGTEGSISRESRATETERTGRATSRVKFPSPRETSQERANRKRAELKRDLEESKSTAKKKRKF